MDFAVLPGTSKYFLNNDSIWVNSFDVSNLPLNALLRPGDPAITITHLENLHLSGHRGTQIRSLAATYRIYTFTVRREGLQQD